MGRRALRKIDPNLDLSVHLRQLDELPDPIDPAAFFAHDGPLEVEVGSGKGLFVAAQSRAVPEHNFLGIEVSLKYARFAASKLARGEVRNAVIVHGDGLRLFREKLADASIEAVHVYFPDPWWKARHKKRRVLNRPFATDVQRVLRPGGVLHFWTDVLEYYEATLDLLAEATTLEGPIDVPERPAEHAMDFRTHFERRTRLGEKPVYRAEFLNNCPASAK